MSWWLFLPFAYLATGINLVCAGDFVWRGAAPDVILLFWSVLTVRAVSDRTMFQVSLLGLLADLSAGSPLGVTSAAFVAVVFLLSRIPREGNSSRLSWLVWGLPLMLATATAIHMTGWLLQPSAVSIEIVFRHSLLTAVVTYGSGVGLTLAYWTLRRLVHRPRDSAPRELDASSFFLSR